jgi:hypothetical protein
VQNWQYAVVHWRDNQAGTRSWQVSGAEFTFEHGFLVDALRQMGENGWELVAVDPNPPNSSSYIFKRPMG